MLATAASDTEAVKDETVYVMTAADGSTQKILVSDWIKNALPAEAQKAIESEPPSVGPPEVERRA